MGVTVHVTEKETKEANKNFVAKMQDPGYVAVLLSDAGVHRPPCFCCLHQVQKTCPHAVGEVACNDFVLYSRSPAKIERKFLEYIEKLRHQQLLQEKSKK